MMTNHQGVVGDVARSLGGSLVTPPVDPSDIKRHFGDLKGFPQIAKLLAMIFGGYLWLQHCQKLISKLL